MSTIRVIVSSVEEQGASHRRIGLVAANGAALPDFDAGAHIDVLLPGGLIRQYSLANAPSCLDRYEICVRREAQSRGGSAYLHDALASGHQLDISTPRNCFALEEAESYVLIAGGIGITPLLSMARVLAERGVRFALHYYGRHEDDTPYLNELRAGFGSSTVTLHFSATGDSLRTAPPSDLQNPARNRLIYLCGPYGFMERIRTDAAKLGWLPSQIRSEAFEAQPVALDSNDAPFEVELASTGQVFVVPVGRTIASVLQEREIAVSLSCEQGICGACLTGIRAGHADHRDEIQSDEEKQANTQIALCCSRSASGRLVLDL